MEPHPGNRDLGAAFRRLFELTPALDDASRDEVSRIRHNVYCRDLGWEPVRDDGRESDEFDRHSLHCLLRRRDTRELVGCTRLILALPDDPCYPLPFENSCREVLDRTVADPGRMPRHTLGEVPRLAVMKTFRQRKGEASAPAPMTDDDFASHGANTRFPFIPVDLYLGAAAIARHVGVERVFVLAELRLASDFVRIGFDIRAVGGPIEHRGTRVPSLLSSSKVVAGLRATIRPPYAVIEAAVDEAFRSAPDARGGPTRLP